MVMTEQEKLENVIKGLKCCAAMSGDECKECPYSKECLDKDLPYGMPHLAANALALLKVQEAVEPHYTKLEYIVNGMPYAVHHPECPRCIENGLILWDAEIERGAAYCKRCGQAVKWE